MAKKVYISGKIGKRKPSKATLKKFYSRELLLKELGYLVFNPTRSGLGAIADILAEEKSTDFYREIMLLDLDALAKCDVIYLLPDYKDSPGAVVELAFANAIGMEILEETKKGIKVWRRR